MALSPSIRWDTYLTAFCRWSLSIRELSRRGTSTQVLLGEKTAVFKLLLLLLADALDCFADCEDVSHCRQNLLLEVATNVLLHLSGWG